MSIALATYGVEVHEFRKGGPLFLKFEKGEMAGSAHATLLKTLQSSQPCQDQPGLKHLISVGKLDADDTDIWGTISLGEYGKRVPIHEANAKEPVFVQQTKHAAMDEYYFRLYLPDDRTKGLLIIQRSGVHGAYVQFGDLLSKAFKAAHKRHFLKMRRIAHPEIVKQMLSGKVYGYKIVTYEVPRDLATFIKNKGPKATVGSLTVSATAKEGEVMWDPDDPPEWYTDSVIRRKPLAEVFPHESIAAIKLTMDYKGKPRQYDVEKIEDIFPYIDVTNKVHVGAEGVVDFDSIDEQAVTIRQDMRQMLEAEA